MRRVRPTFVLVVLFASGSLAGCGPSEGVDPEVHPDLTADDADVRVADAAAANLVLHVSNQSLDDEIVRLTVAVDAVTVVDGDFYVEDQHNFLTYRLAMSPGNHEVTAKADTGATLEESFETTVDTPRYALIEYSGEDDSADLGWSYQRQQMAFG